MEKVDKDFYDYALKESPGDEFTHWIEKMYSEYTAGPRCKLCGGKNISLTIDPKVILWCHDCQKYYENITIDTISKINYNAVTLVHEDKIREILGALDAI